MDIHLVAIVGGSGSGKTWLVEHLLGEFGSVAGRLSLDDFYRDLSALGEQERAQTNFDHPQAIDWPRFTRALRGIRRGEAVSLPDYDFATHTRRPLEKSWRPCPLVLLDGLWLLRRAALRQLYDLSVYLECPEELRRERRVQRDRRERGRSVASIQMQFDQHVSPMHRRFVVGQALKADLRLSSPPSAGQLGELRSRCRRWLLRPTLP